MTIAETHEFIQFIVDKELGGYSTPEEIDMALDKASLATFRQMAAYYAENQTFQDALAPFKRQFVFTPTTSAGGLVTIKADYLRFLSVWTLQYNNDTLTNSLQPIKIVNDDELAERLKSQLAPVTQAKPIMQWVGKGKFQIFPRVGYTGEVWYLKRPDKPVFAFTQTGRDVVQNVNRSVDLEWGDGEMLNVMYRALQFLGVNLSDEQMIQYTQLKLTDA